MTETQHTPGKTPTPRVSARGSDEELLVRYCDQGEVAAFETLVQRYEKPIYNYLLRYLRNAPLAEEVFQATFLRLHEKCQLYQKDQPLRPWLYRSATHQAIDALRKEEKHHAVSLDDQPAGNGDDLDALLQLVESAAPSPSQQTEERERRDWTRQAVDALPEHQRTAVLLVFFQGLKYRQAAEILEVPEGTLKSRIHKAMVALNQAWRRDHGENGP
jgi:RNA polymerase sigma-70 factor (ECF subfamily)